MYTSADRLYLTPRLQECIYTSADRQDYKSVSILQQIGFNLPQDYKSVSMLQQIGFKYDELSLKHILSLKNIIINITIYAHECINRNLNNNFFNLFRVLSYKQYVCILLLLSYFSFTIIKGMNIIKSNITQA